MRQGAKKAGEWERADDISLEWLAEMAGRVTNLVPWGQDRLADIQTCLVSLGRGRPIRFAEDKKHLAALVNEAYQNDPPLTSGGASGNQKTSTSRDTLAESGSELLEEYAEAGPN